MFGRPHGVEHGQTWPFERNLAPESLNNETAALALLTEYWDCTS